jgi:hypothetical protein
MTSAMRSERFTPTSIHVRRSGAIFHRSLYIILLAAATLAISAASAVGRIKPDALSPTFAG